MGTQDAVAELRAEIARLRRLPWRGFGGLVFVAVLVTGFTALLLVFAVRPRDRAVIAGGFQREG